MADDGDNLPSDLTEHIRNLKFEIQESTASFFEERGRSPIPQMIYHYTNDVGLHGIIKSRTLWLTDIFQLNDPSELRYGISHAINALTEKAGDNPDLIHYVAGFRERVSGYIESFGNFFTCSFSKTHEELGQWRAYADDGHGYALGFDANLLTNEFKKHLNGPYLQGISISYSADNDKWKIQELQKIVSDLAMAHIRAVDLKNYGNEIGLKYWNKISKELISELLHIATYFKHPTYRYEQEYRFLRVQDVAAHCEDISYRKRPYELVRYIDFSWKNVAASALKEIWIGPAADKEKSERFVHDCLRAHHKEYENNVDIKSSDIPYRSFRS